eukprot:1255794-Rhodomonas_salina.2
MIYTIPGYRGVWTAKVQRYAESIVATGFLERIRGWVLNSFLARQGVGREHLGEWLWQCTRSPDATS